MLGLIDVVGMLDGSQTNLAVLNVSSTASSAVHSSAIAHTVLNVLSP